MLAHQDALENSDDLTAQFVIEVRDSGPGVAPEHLPRLFEPFYRGRDSNTTRGTGLGLTIVQQIARAHGGAVMIDHRRARGAAFTLRIPAEAPSA